MSCFWDKIGKSDVKVMNSRYSCSWEEWFLTGGRLQEPNLGQWGAFERHFLNPPLIPGLKAYPQA